MTDPRVILDAHTLQLTAFGDGHTCNETLTKCGYNFDRLLSLGRF